MAGCCNIALDCNLAGRDTVLQHVGLQQAGKEPKKLAAKPAHKFADDPELSAIEVPAVRAGSIRSAGARGSQVRFAEADARLRGLLPSTKAALAKAQTCNPLEAPEPAEPSGRYLPAPQTHAVHTRPRAPMFGQAGGRAGGCR